MSLTKTAIPALFIFCLLSVFGCKNNSKQLVDIMIEVDRETFNPVLEPDVTGSISITGIYSDGTTGPVSDCEIILNSETKVASGNAEVIKIEGSKIFPGLLLSAHILKKTLGSLP